MATITKRFIWLCCDAGPRSSHLYPIHHHFSTFSDPSPNSPGPETDPERQSTSSSYFNDVKASLRRGSPPYMRPQMQRKTFSFSNSTPLHSPPSKIASLHEINKNLSEFRRRSAVPPPSSSDQPPSLQELYIKNISSQTDSSNSTTPSKYPFTATGGKASFDTIRDSLRQLRATNMSQRQNDSTGNPMDPMSLARLKESMKLKPGEMNVPQLIIRGSDRLPTSLIGKDIKEVGGKDNEASTAGTLKFVRPYRFEEMGKKLESLRPEKKGKWFSLQELNDRLERMRVLEEKEIEARSSAFIFREFKESLVTINLKSEEQAKRHMHKQYVLSLGGTPSFMLEQPPKDHLVEKYFHPDHMSSADKLKLELQKVRDEFKMSESDCGSARVQVAQLTTKIKHLSTLLHKKDKHSRKGLQEMVQRRKKLLRYLRRTDWDSYTLVLSKLGLRDNPDLKA